MICSGSNVTLPAPRYTYQPTLSPYTWRRRPRPVDCGSEEGTPSSLANAFNTSGSPTFTVLEAPSTLVDREEIEIPDGAPNSLESLFVRQAVVIQPHFL